MLRLMHYITSHARRGAEHNKRQQKERVGNQRETGDQWGEMFPGVEMPIPHTREGLRQAARVATKRRPSDPHIAPNSWGQHRIHFGDEPELAGASVQMDGANLAYQRELLAGRA
jgi:hypothetical protein